MAAAVKAEDYRRAHQLKMRRQELQEELESATRSRKGCTGPMFSQVAGVNTRGRAHETDAKLQEGAGAPGGRNPVKSIPKRAAQVLRFRRVSPSARARARTERPLSSTQMKMELKQSLKS